MPRYIHTLITTSFLSLALLACNSNTEPATARTPPSGFGETPAGNNTDNVLQYDTSSAARREIIEKLDDYYAAQARAGFNGSVLVGHNGKVVYKRSWGYANREHKIPLAPNSPCQLASISKTFTGAAILYLNERKYLNIDDPVVNYIKDFPYAGVTIRMLLSHRSGIPDYIKWYGLYRKDNRTPVSNATIMQMMARFKPKAESRPNTRFKYCNTNYVVLSRIIEVVTEQSYSDFMQKYIFAPLGMKNTFVYNPDVPLPNHAAISYKYNWVREPDMFADGVTGDKGIYSTVEDMYRWDQSFYKKRLLSNETIELAYGPCSFEKPGIKNYGLGWRMLCYPDGGKVIYHNGWWHGNNTSFYRLIKENITIIILGNKYNSGIYRQAPVIYSILKGTPVTKGFDSEG